MVANVLLTFCTGLTCIVTESNTTYGTIQAESTVRFLSSNLEAERARLDGFQEWLTVKTENGRLDFVSSVNGIVNPILGEIKQLIDEASNNGKNVDECYSEAFGNIKQATEQKLPSISQCINSFVESSTTNLGDVPTRLAEAATLKVTVDSILSDCATNDDRVGCINEKANDATSEVYSIDNFSRQTIQKGNDDYYTDYDAANTCLTPILNELETSVNNYKSQVVTCIHNA